ncbi:hypothetical protein AHAS_Ahas02G0207100 [Arachis hypogaea]
MSSRSSFEFLFLVIPMIFMIIVHNNNPCYCRVLDQAEDSKVNVTLNYQSLCEGCARYIKSDLGNLYNNSELMSIVNLHLLPFGNAHIDQNQTVQCQHGPNECYLNTIEACALHEWPLCVSLNMRQEKSFAFIKCVEVGVLKKSDDDDELKSLWNSCCEELKLDSNPIKDCYESGRGNKLLLGYGEESKAQVPPHMFVPWVTVNDVPLEFDIFNVSRHVCNAYKGSLKLKACNKNEMHGAATSSDEEFKLTRAVCYAN